MGIRANEGDSWVDRRGRLVSEGFRVNGAVPENLSVFPRSDRWLDGDPSVEESLRMRMKAAANATGPGGSGFGSALEWVLADIWPMSCARRPPRSMGIGLKADGIAAQVEFALATNAAFEWKSKD